MAKLRMPTEKPLIHVPESISQCLLLVNANTILLLPLNFKRAFCGVGLDRWRPLKSELRRARYRDMTSKTFER
jgi:hypothetical protein